MSDSSRENAAGIRPAGGRVSREAPGSSGIANGGIPAQLGAVLGRAIGAQASLAVHKCRTGSLVKALRLTYGYISRTGALPWKQSGTQANGSPGVRPWKQSGTQAKGCQESGPGNSLAPRLKARQESGPGNSLAPRLKALRSQALETAKGSPGVRPWKQSGTQAKGSQKSGPGNSLAPRLTARQESGPGNSLAPRLKARQESGPGNSLAPRLTAVRSQQRTSQHCVSGRLVGKVDNPGTLLEGLSTGFPGTPKCIPLEFNIGYVGTWGHVESVPCWDGNVVKNPVLDPVTEPLASRRREI
ncbi:hypothetical protein Bbelb_060710 [Branchiostoma belcheri]|nr:hypothetical protein Bbelb_060710 [Branchiostoma belcheri]